MSLPTLTTSGQSLHALLLALDYRLGSKKNQKKQTKTHTCVCEQSAERWSSTLGSSPQIQETCVCVSISREHKGELLQHMETEMEGGNEKVLSEDGATSRAEK